MGESSDRNNPGEGIPWGYAECGGKRPGKIAIGTSRPTCACTTMQVSKNAIIYNSYIKASVYGPHLGLGTNIATANGLAVKNWVEGHTKRPSHGPAEKKENAGYSADKLG